MTRLRWPFRTSSRSQRARFTAIFRRNSWGDRESVSGPGSTQARASDFTSDLIALIDRFNVRSILDAPCGDFNWMCHIVAARDVTYTGIDIVEELIDANARLYGASNRRFVCSDMTRAPLPHADLVICRDGLVHLSTSDARAALENFRRSKSRYLLATTFDGRSSNPDIRTASWRPLNMQAPPFDFPPPLASIDERCLHSEGVYRDKRLALWELATLRD